MFELKKGMKVQIKEFTDIYTFKEIDVLKNEYYLYNFDKVIFKHTPDEIDWEETAKLNGIDLELEKEKKLYIDTCVENGMSIEEAIKECEIVSKPFDYKYFKDKEIGYKETKGKIRPNLLPITELKDVIRVFEYGVEKYSKDNWKHVKEPIEEYSNALSRHLLDYLEGEKKASDSNLPHLAHICANALILMWFENNKEE